MIYNVSMTVMIPMSVVEQVAHFTMDGVEEKAKLQLLQRLNDRVTRSGTPYRDLDGNHIEIFDRDITINEVERIEDERT